jgi:lysophospholipase L1-like esterase
VNKTIGKQLRKKFRMGLVGGTALMMGAALIVSTGATAAGAQGQHYYLALGDSLSQGYQPNANGIGTDTDQGYVDDIYSSELASDSSLVVEKLGCPGETTKTFIKGGICPIYSNQLNDAARFLKKHGADTSFVTIDIGANNVDNCVTGLTVNLECINAGVEHIEHQLPIILSTLEAADPSVPIYGMNYYDPFLAAYLDGSSGQSLAALSLDLAQSVNGTLDTIYGDYNVPVADVADAFGTYDNTFNNGDMIGGNPVPDDVYNICALTYMCAASPVGPNIHANPTGYQTIANAFLAIPIAPAL